jgi:hypothetical protein
MMLKIEHRRICCPWRSTLAKTANAVYNSPLFDRGLETAGRAPLKLGAISAIKFRRVVARFSAVKLPASFKKRKERNGLSEDSGGSAMFLGDTVEESSEI